MNSCPSGTLPFVGSLYYLNTDTFTEQEISNRLNDRKSFDINSFTPPANVDYAIAIDLSG